MDKVKKVLFIINKFAGTGYSPELEDKIVQTSKRKNVEAILEFTRGPQHGTNLAKEAAKRGIDRVVAVGGDGTLNEVAQGLVHSNVPMGIIPRGSGNGLARHLAIPLSVQGALDTFYAGQILQMDTFTLNNKLSLNVSGIGFDGHIANLFGGKTKRGLAGYASLSMREFLRFKEFNSIITTGSDTWKSKSFVLAVANSSQYGNNACIAPAASVTDGVLHLNILKKIPPYRFDVIYAFFKKTIDRSPFCDIRIIKEVTIETETNIPYHVDGEPCGSAQKFHIAISPATLPIIVPAETGVC
jgi:diacylglycerol kinase (ATP)